MPRQQIYPRKLEALDAHHVKDQLMEAEDLLDRVADRLKVAFGPNNRMTTGAVGLSLACGRLRDKIAAVQEKVVDKADPSDII